MSGVDLTGLFILLLFVGLLVFFMTIDRRRPATFRPIRGYEALKGAIGGRGASPFVAWNRVGHRDRLRACVGWAGDPDKHCREDDDE